MYINANPQIEPVVMAIQNQSQEQLGNQNVHIEVTVVDEDMYI